MVDGTPIANSKDYEIIEHNGIKIGVIGLAEYDWIVTLSHYEVDELSFTEPAQRGDELAIMLRKANSSRRSVRVRLHHRLDPHESAERPKTLQRDQRN